MVKSMLFGDLVMRNKRIKKQFYLCLTHDIDRTDKGLQCLTQSIRYLVKGDLKTSCYHLFALFLNNKYWNFQKIIDIEKKYGVKSTFFFMDESIKFNLLDVKNWKLSLGRYRMDDLRIRKVISFLDRNGWEIGLHGSYNSYKNLELLKTEKIKLEKILNHEVIGIRQHYLNLDGKTWKKQEKAGFLYDATFGFKKKVGFKCNKFKPFFPLGKNNNFMVIPLAIMDKNIMKKKNIKGTYLKIISDVEKKKGVLILNWHQICFNEKAFPGYAKLYEDIIKECVRRKAKIVRCKDLLKGGW
jgi:peptidoglycan/xylan/chitin deacetylase (PgdA/CDA1 family)